MKYRSRYLICISGHGLTKIYLKGGYNYEAVGFCFRDFGFRFVSPFVSFISMNKGDRDEISDYLLLVEHLWDISPPINPERSHPFFHIRGKSQQHSRRPVSHVSFHHVEETSKN